MLDTAGILFSTLMIAYVVLQAVKLDRIQAWFEALKSDAAATVAAAASHRTWNRR